MSDKPSRGEVLQFIETLARQINGDLELGLDTMTVRRVALRVLAAEPEGAEELHRSLGCLLIRERTLH